MKQNAKPKILSFTHYGTLYGANRSLLTLLISLKGKVNWFVICREEGDFTRELAQNNIEFKVIPFTLDVHQISKRFQFFDNFLRFCFNVVIACYLAPIVYLHKVSLIHTNSSVIFLGSLVSLLTGRKHIWHIREFVFEDYGLKYNFGKSSFKFLAERAATMVCISKSIHKKRIIDTGISTHSPVIYNGLVEHQKNRYSRNGIRKVPVIGIVGIIDPAKDQFTAIKAVNILIKKNKNVILQIVGNVGSNEYFEVLKKYIKDEGIDEQIKFVGFSKDIDTIFKNLDVSLMCSHHEALGRVTIESMMNGVPVVAYGAEGTNEIIEGEKTGLIYYGDESSLAVQLDRILLDEDLYRQISKQALEHVVNNFTIEKYAQNFLKEVNQCLS